MNESLLCSALSRDTTTDRLSDLPTIRSDLHGATANDSLLCSTLSRDTTSDNPIYRLSALICMAILQTIIYCALL
jgi:hypothetical protein